MRHRRHAAATTATLAALGFAGGMTAGVWMWSAQLRRSRRELFSPSPVRRLAALGYLRGNRRDETAQLLSEYVRWEPRAALRRRGEALLRDLGS